MRRVKNFFVALTVMLTGFPAAAQTIGPVLEFFGTDSAEELNPYDVERLEEYLSRPLRINQTSISRLEESGLLTRYQAASLVDYRSRHGDILSMTELAAVDGFSRDFVARLAPFISLESRRMPGHPSESPVMNDISVKSGIRSGKTMTYGMKYKLTAGERLTAGIAVSRTSEADRTAPDAFSGHLALHSKRRPGKLVIGDFNARFGQGLALWNGMSFSGLTSASTFMRKPAGISASSSFTGGYALHGIAGDMRTGRLSISAMTAVSREKDRMSLLPAMNISWFLRNGQVSLTHYSDFAISGAEVRIPDMKTSADFAFCRNGTDSFAEFAYDWVSSSIAGVGGVSFSASDDVRISAMLRYYPSSYSSERSAAARSTTKCSNESAASAAMDFSSGRWVEMNGASGFGSSVRRHSGNLSADFAYFPVPKTSDPRRSIQIKAQGEWKVMLSGAFRMTLRISERVRTWGEPFRTDLRTEFSYFSRRFLANLRLNALRCEGTGLLAYAEGGYKTGELTFYARTGIFRIDNWDDRIYAYERDAPGSFNVPAYYGRGVWAALTMNWKFARWGRMYIRAAATSYPFMAEKKPGRAELKFQFVFRL